MKKRRAFWIAVLVLVLDRALKMAAPSLPAEGLVLIPKVLRLRLVKNEGIAFSFLSGEPLLLGFLSLALVLAAVWFLRRRRFSPPVTVCLMMMLGGAVGNMLDRFFLGYVPDMLELLFVDFPVFNLADLFLSVGCAGVMVALLFGKQPSENA